MEFTKESSEEFKNLLKRHSIASKRDKIDDMESVYDALHELKRYLSEDSMGQIWPENIGTDQDANKDYEDYLKGFKALTKKELKFKNLSSTMDGDNVEMSFTDDSGKITWKFEQSSDSFSSEFVDYLFNYSKKVGSNQLIDLLSEDMFEFAYVPNEIGDFLHVYELYE